MGETDMKLVVVGAAGRMGQTLIRTVHAMGGVSLHAAIERPGSPFIGRDAGELAGLGPIGVPVTDQPLEAFVEAEGVLDFTAPAGTVEFAGLAAQARIVHVIGTTGCSADDEAKIRAAARHARIVKSGNMSLGVNLLAALVEQAKAQAAARLVKAYGYAVVAAERARVLTDLLTSARAEAELIAERMRNGDAIARDASLAAVEAARHEVMLAETQADLLRARSELAELLGFDITDSQLISAPPSLQMGGRAVRPGETPHARSLAAEARFYSSSAERLRKEGQSPLSVGLVAGRGDFGETRLGGGLAYAFPVFRANRPERARAAAESARALAEKSVQEAVTAGRLRRLQREQAELIHARSVLTQTALPAAQLAVSAVQETYAAGKTEMLAVLLSRRELSALSLRRLELLLQDWLLVGEYVEITGDLP